MVGLWICLECLWIIDVDIWDHLIFRGDIVKDSKFH
jgi:hypothetical protein